MPAREVLISRQLPGEGDRARAHRVRRGVYRWRLLHHPLTRPDTPRDSGGLQ